MRKRQHAERVKGETQRLYEERKTEAKQNKTDMMSVISRYRDDKLASLEARKQSMLLNKQEGAFRKWYSCRRH